MNCTHLLVASLALWCTFARRQRPLLSQVLTTDLEFSTPGALRPSAVAVDCCIITLRVDIQLNLVVTIMKR